MCVVSKQNTNGHVLVGWRQDEVGIIPPGDADSSTVQLFRQTDSVPLFPAMKLKNKNSKVIIKNVWLISRISKNIYSLFIKKRKWFNVSFLRKSLIFLSHT